MPNYKPILARLGQVLALVLLAAVLTPALAMPLVGLTTATYGPTKSSDIPKIWRKVQAELQPGFQFLVEEWEMMEDMDQFDVDWTTREILVPVDTVESYGASSIPEGGYETKPSSPAPNELTLTFIMLNKRWSNTKLTRYIDERSRGAQITRQLKYQGQKAMQAVARTYGDYFWGFSTGYLAQTSTVATQASGTYTLLNGYASTTIPATSTAQKNFIAGKFKVGDRVALIRAAALVANAIGVVTAVTPATPSIDVTWNGSVTSANLDYVVLANSLENTTIAGTDYNIALTGWLDAMLSTSLHGLATSTDPNWAPAYNDTSGGRFSGLKIHRAADEIYNHGGGKADVVWMSQGVNRDLLALQQAALRFSDPFALEVDGDIKAKGKQFKKSRRVPPGYAFVGVNASLKRMTLLPKPNGNPGWADAKELIDQSGYVFSVDFPCALVWPNRGNFAYFSSLTEQ